MQHLLGRGSGPPLDPQRLSSLSSGGISQVWIKWWIIHPPGCRGNISITVYFMCWLLLMPYEAASVIISDPLRIPLDLQLPLLFRLLLLLLLLLLLPHPDGPIYTQLEAQSQLRHSGH